MKTRRCLNRAAAACIATAAPALAWSAPSDYTFVKMSLTVPWTLYFVFLACVLIPFVLMVVLAWRGAAQPEPEPKDAAGAEPAGRRP